MGRWCEVPAPLGISTAIEDSPELRRFRIRCALELARHTTRPLAPRAEDSFMAWFDRTAVNGVRHGHALTAMDQAFLAHWFGEVGRRCEVLAGASRQLTGDIIEHAMTEVLARARRLEARLAS